MRVDGLSDPFPGPSSLYGIQESKGIRADWNKHNGTHSYNRVPILLVRPIYFFGQTKQRRLTMANFLRTVHIMQFNADRLSDASNSAECLLLVCHASHTYLEKQA